MIVEEQISIIEEQIAARQQRARKTIQNILTGPVGQAYGDYVVKSASGREYRVAMRGPSLFENFCSCPDFAVNTLGTQSVAQDDNGKSVSFIPDPSQAAAKFLEAGLTLLESLFTRCNADVRRATHGFEPIKRGLSTLLRTDAQTQLPTLTIPLPESITAERLARVISGFVGNLSRPS